jgi:hypothetical protein
MNFVNVLFWDAVGSGGIVLTSKASCQWDLRTRKPQLWQSDPSLLTGAQRKIVTHNVGAQTCNTFN